MKRFFLWLERFVQNSARAKSAQNRFAQISELSQKSDAELELLSIRRDEIARYVFRDAGYA